MIANFIGVSEDKAQRCWRNFHHLSEKDKERRSLKKFPELMREVLISEANGNK